MKFFGKFRDWFKVDENKFFVLMAFVVFIFISLLCFQTCSVERTLRTGEFGTVSYRLG